MGEACWARAVSLHWRAITKETEARAQEAHVRPGGAPSAGTVYLACTSQSVRELLGTELLALESEEPLPVTLGTEEKPTSN